MTFATITRDLAKERYENFLQLPVMFDLVGEIDVLQKAYLINKDESVIPDPISPDLLFVNRDIQIATSKIARADILENAIRDIERKFKESEKAINYILASKYVAIYAKSRGVEFGSPEDYLKMHINCYNAMKSIKFNYPPGQIDVVNAITIVVYSRMAERMQMEITAMLKEIARKHQAAE